MSQGCLARAASVGVALALLLSGCSSTTQTSTASASASASSQPTPTDIPIGIATTDDESLATATAAMTPAAPSPGPTLPVPLHLATYIQTSGCFYNTNGAGCPAPPDGMTPQQAWNVVGQYLTYVETDKRATAYAATAGILPGFYVDVGLAHNNYQPVNRYTASQVVLDANKRIVYLDRSNTEGCWNGAAGANYPKYPGVCASPAPSPDSTPIDGSVYGDPASTDLHALARQQVASQLADQWSSHYPQSFVRLDDMGYYGWNVFHSCAGMPTWSQYRNGCPPPALSGHPYFQKEMTPTWIAAVHSLFDSLQLPVLFNNLWDPTLAVYFTPNVLGGECETCIVINPYAGNGKNTYWDESHWMNHMNAGFAAEQNGKIIHYLTTNVATQDDENYLFASLMLIENDPTKVVITERALTDEPAVHPKASSLQVSPMVNIVAMNPVGPSPTLPTDAIQPGVYDRANPPRDIGIGVFKEPGGAYFREFRDCYTYGVRFGACATVVNPTSTPVVALDFAAGYTHTAVAKGHGVLKAFGDDGTVSVGGPHLPAVLAPHTGYILTP